MISITTFFIGCRAQFQENRSIFNTPNPRLMNVSLLKESKSQGQGQGVSRNASTRKSTIKARNASKSIRRSIYDAEVDKHRVSLLCATAGVSIIGSVHFVNVVLLLSVVLHRRSCKFTCKATPMTFMCVMLLTSLLVRFSQFPFDSKAIISQESTRKPNLICLQFTVVTHSFTQHSVACSSLALFP